MIFLLSILFLNACPGRAELELEQDAMAEVNFKSFVIRFNKTYINDKDEYAVRLHNFKASLKRHQKLNERERKLGGTAEYGINKFSDLTPEEFREFLKRGFGPPQPIMVTSSEMRKVNCSVHYCFTGNQQVASTEHSSTVIPDKWDWRKTPSGSKVTAVRNQGKCGGCWAFTAVETVESQWAIADNPLTKLSVQEMISCGNGSFLRGCKGGNTCEALAWLLTGSSMTKIKPIHLVKESEYPFEGKDSKCKYKSMPSRGVSIFRFCGCRSMIGCEHSLMTFIIGIHGPMGINVDAVLWHDYIGGIIQHHCSNLEINHAVQIVGYDKTGPIPFWIIKNSWGADFGIDGYLHIKMGQNLCGVTEQPSYVIV